MRNISIVDLANSEDGGSGFPGDAARRVLRNMKVTRQGPQVQALRAGLMNLGELLYIWRRRPILTVTLLVVALTGATTALLGLPRTYQSNSSVVLLASRSAARQTGGNPYMSFSSSLTLTADVISGELMAPRTAAVLAARGYSDPYTVALAPYNTATTGSVLLVQVTGSNRRDVQRELAAVTQQVSAELAQIQANIRPESRIRIATISFSPRAALDVGQTARPMVVVIAAALLLVLGVPVIVDARGARRAARARPALADEHQEPVDHAAYDTFRTQPQFLE